MVTGRLPQSDEQLTDLRVLSQTLQCLLSQHGFTDQPFGGCPAGVGATSVDEKEVSQIVQTVMAELKSRGMV